MNRIKMPAINRHGRAVCIARPFGPTMIGLLLPFAIVLNLLPANAPSPANEFAGSGV